MTDAPTIDDALAAIEQLRARLDDAVGRGDLRASIDLASAIRIEAEKVDLPIDAQGEVDAAKARVAAADPERKAWDDLTREATTGKRAQPASGDGAGRRVELIRGDSVTIEPTGWLWRGWLARGKLHVLAGAPGTGKTTIASAVSATITIGGRWPDGTRAELGDVLIWSGEDDPGDTLAPRLLAAGADMQRVHFVTGTRDDDGRRRPFDPARDMPQLVHTASELRDLRLIVIDPIVNAIGAADSHRNAEVRIALAPVVELAAAIGCAVLGITHFTKGTAGRDPVERVTGSLAFGALARIVLATARRSEAEGGGRLIARAKSNIGPDSGGFGYTLDVVDVSGHPGVTVTRVLWGAAIEGSARELLAAAEAQPDGGDGVDVFLRGLLATGSVGARSVLSDASGAGYSRDQVQRAARRLGIERHKDGMRGGWAWSLPESPKVADLAAHRSSPPSPPSPPSKVAEKEPKTAKVVKIGVWQSSPPSDGGDVESDL